MHSALFGRVLLELKRNDFSLNCSDWLFAELCKVDLIVGNVEIHHKVLHKALDHDLVLFAVLGALSDGQLNVTLVLIIDIT